MAEAQHSDAHFCHWWILSAIECFAGHHYHHYRHGCFLARRHFLSIAIGTLISFQIRQYTDAQTDGKGLHRYPLVLAQLAIAPGR